MKLEKLTTRQCKISDYSFIYSLTRRCLFKFINKYSKWDKKFFDNKFQKRYKNIVILLVGKRRIGYYEISEKKDFLYINDILLTGSYRNKGIGSYLLRKFKDETKKKKLCLEIWNGNPAINLYKKLGYKTTKIKNHKVLMEMNI